ncbi:MAG: DsbA family protein [Planctomycetes bacterium]|jgi:protein-disulfide isomerase|nr:DsbA family protein [Planctomycetota bacterium]
MKHNPHNKKKNYSALFFVIVSVFTFALILIFLSVSGLGVSQPVSMVTVKHIPKNLRTPADSADPLISSFEPNKLTAPIISKDDPSLGRDNVKVRLVYFSDYDCEYCQKQEKEIKSLFQKYKNKIQLIRKDYPTINPVSISYQAALSARCAQKQNKFWEYDSLLVKSDLAKKNYKFFVELADQIGLNKESFVSCLSDKSVIKLIENNIQEAQDLGIMGTPFLFINEQEFMGETGGDELERVIKEELLK